MYCITGNFSFESKGENTMRTNTAVNQTSATNTKKLVTMSLLSALAYVLMLIHLPFKFLGFLEIEFSDIPAVIAALQFGPFAGVVVELIKNLIKALTASTTGMVGELANFIISSAFMIPVGALYKLRKLKNVRNSGTTANNDTKNHWNGAHLIIIFVIATISFAVTGALVNYFVTLPLYAKLFGGMDVVVGVAAAHMSAIRNAAGLVIVGITPFNILKGIGMSVLGYWTYKMLKGRVLE
jgi:riboflavin transporter FmnP